MFPQWAIDRYGLAKCKRAGELAFKGGGKDNTHRIGTPPEFRELLLAIAATAEAPNVELRGAEPTGGASRSNEGFGVAGPQGGE